MLPDVPLASLPKPAPHESMDMDPPPIPHPSPTKRVAHQDAIPMPLALSDTVLNSAKKKTLITDGGSETSSETSSSPQKEKGPVIPPSEVFKRMSGELPVVISCDRRHRYFADLHTVRFKLVG